MTTTPYDLEHLLHLRHTDAKVFSKEVNRIVKELGHLPEEINTVIRTGKLPDPKPEPEPQRPTIDEVFKKYLPTTMYLSHYDLSIQYGFTPQEWRTYLRDNALFIETELAAIAEAEARSALSRLGNASGQEVQALKAILEKSKLINDAQKQQTKIMLTFIPQATKEVPPSNDKRNDDSENMQSISGYARQEESRLW